MIDIDEDVSRKITKMALVIYAVLFLLSPAQPLLCSTLMGVAAIAPTLLGPNPLRILGLLAFAVAGYMFWPQYQESKKIPARNEVRLALARAEPLRAAVVKYVAEQHRLPGEDVPDLKASDEKADIQILPGGTIEVKLKFVPLAGLSVRLVPVVSGTLQVPPAPASAAPIFPATAATPPAASAAPTAPAAPTADTAAGSTGTEGAAAAANTVAPATSSTTGVAAPSAAAADPSSAAAPAAVPPASSSAAPSIVSPAVPDASPPARSAGSPIVLSWSCVSDDIAQSYLPGNCRNSENLRRAANMKK